MASQAAADGVQLLVFPEALLGGYPRGADFGAVVGDRSGAGREEFLAYSNQAVTCPGPELLQLGDIAARARTSHSGRLHREAGTSLYCATATFDDAGSLIGRRRP